MTEPREPAGIPEEAEPQAERAPMTTRGMVIVGARSVGGLLACGLAVVTVAAASWLPLPTLGAGPASTVVMPVAAMQQLICPGPVLRLGDELGQEATTALPIGRPDVVRASTRGTPALLGMGADGTEVRSQRLTLAPAEEGEEPGLLSGAQSQRAEEADYVGFVAVGCARPSSEVWLVGGSTLTGRTTLLVLTNPSQVGSIVDLDLYSEDGPVEAAGTEGIVVPPEGQRVLSLAGFAPGMASPVVHVRSTGGQVTAELQESIVRTLDPGGVDLIGAGASPATTTVIPGIVVVDHEAIEAAQSLEGHRDLGGTLRVFIPGTGSVPITVSAAMEDGSSPPNTTTVPVDAGVVTELPLGHFAEGSYTITVTSPVPAVAAVRTSTVTLAEDAPAASGEEPVVVATDFAWFVSASELQGSALLSLAPGPAATLHLVNTGSADVEVAIAATTGTGYSASVPAGATAAVPVADGTSYLLSGFDTLRASVSYRDEGSLAGYTVSAPGRASQPVTVYH